MLKKLRKITSLLLVTVMVVLVFTPATVGAVIPGEDSYHENIPAASPNALRSIMGNQASASLRRCLAEYNINVNSNTLLEVIPSSIENGKTALLVTNVEGARITTNYMFALDNDGNVLSVSEPSTSEYALCDAVGGEEDPFRNGSFRCVWTVVYNSMYLSGRFCTQPEFAQFIYFNTGGHTVQSVEMLYLTAGEAYDYPGGTYLGSTLHTHTMQIFPSSPRSNLYYVATNAYRTDRAICTEFPGSHKVEFYFTINNRNIWGDHYLANQVVQ